MEYYIILADSAILLGSAEVPSLIILSEFRAASNGRSCRTWMEQSVISPDLTEIRSTGKVRFRVELARTSGFNPLPSVEVGDTILALESNRVFYK